MKALNISNNVEISYESQGNYSFNFELLLFFLVLSEMLNFDRLTF